jgi:oxygen-dependent protoporphyrinogen oxidase
MKHVTIVGAGITGVAAAYYLQKKSAERGLEISYTLLEASNRLGGKVVTDTEKGFVIEGGPDSFVTEKPWGLQFCHDLGLGSQLIPANEIQRKIYILRKGRLVAFPSGLRLTIPTEILPFVLSPLISPLGKLRMAMDYVIPPRSGGGDESLASFIRRRLGQECVERIAGPVMAGIFVSDPERLSMMCSFPRFLEMERAHGSLIRAARAARRKPHPHNPLAAGHSMFNSLKGGAGAVIEAARKQLRGEIRLTCAAQGIERVGSRFRIGTSGGPVESDAVVLAVPAFEAARAVQSLHPRLANLLNAIRYVGTATISSAYLREDIPPGIRLDGYGVLVPASEQRDLIACTWSSVKFKHRAPAGCALLRAFVGGPRAEEKSELPDDQLRDLVAREYASMFGIKRKPMLQRIYRWPRGNPQFDVGHLDRVDEMERAAAEVPGLLLAGSAYRGVGMPDCIKSAVAAVDRILTR